MILLGPVIEATIYRFSLETYTPALLRNWVLFVDSLPCF